MGHVMAASVDPGHLVVVPLFSIEVGQSYSELVGFPSPNQLTYDNHPFFRGFHPLLSSAKAFYNSILSFKGDIFDSFRVA